MFHFYRLSIRIVRLQSVMFEVFGLACARAAGRCVGPPGPPLGRGLTGYPRGLPGPLSGPLLGPDSSVLGTIGPRDHSRAHTIWGACKAPGRARKLGYQP